MLCCRCGVETPGVELTPNIHSPICPSCYSRHSKARPAKAATRRPTKPGPPATALPGRKLPTTKTRKKP